MDKLNEYIKTQIPEDFSINDNKAMLILYECMQDLKKNGLEIDKASANEKPQRQLGDLDKKLRERIILVQNNIKKQRNSQFSTRNNDEPLVRI